MPRTVRIGGASGFWGDSQIAVPQLLKVPGLDYLVFDYLAETTMSILSRAKAKDRASGYATDFVTQAMGPNLKAISAGGIRVVANAGGLNPGACAAALRALIAEAGLDLPVAVVEGDDLMPRLDDLRRLNVRDLETGAALPAKVMSANAYLGARPIAAALERGARIVVTGRCVDSAIVVGPLVHEFGWSWTDWDRLASGTLAGHVIECGAQATGGLFTDWKRVVGWDDIGYPVIECAEDGSFVVTKPAGTGGLVEPAAVAEQILYEIGDPASYAMPDVVCDLRRVTVEANGPERVRVAGARGRPPSDRLKVSVTVADGYQLDPMLAIRGFDAVEKAEKTAEALLRRTRRQMSEAGFADYAATLVEFLGAEALYGPHGRGDATREVVLRLAVRHADRRALEFLRREVTSPGTSMGPGTRGHFSGRTDIRPVVRLFSCFAPSDMAVAQVVDGKGTLVVPAPASAPMRQPDEVAPVGAVAPEDPVPVRLIELAWARSGDKGDDCNIGIIARKPDYLPVLRHGLTVEAVASWMAHLATGPVERFDLPGIKALNFVIRRALGGGGMASLRSDPLGKSFAQILLEMPVPVPSALMRRDGLQSLSM
ncbi:MAG: DUF1446 domain-containing protein [Rhodospirillaceae bacterium]|nr:DUF1446 domain-containing protein [Rhodospirillaceae bacterium]